MRESEGKFFPRVPGHIPKTEKEVNKEIKTWRSEIGFQTELWEAKNAYHVRATAQFPRCTFDRLPPAIVLQKYYREEIKQKQPLKDLLANEDRNSRLRFNFDKLGLIVDLTHTKVDEFAWEKTCKVALDMKILEKIVAMFEGDQINDPLDEGVLHTALRMESDERFMYHHEDVVHDVHIELERIQQFSEAIRNGTLSGHTGKPIKNIVAIGTGGSVLGTEFVYEALRFDSSCKAASEGMTLKLLGSVDPTDFHRATDGLDIE